MPIHGYNISDTNGNDSIPNGYILNSKTDMDEVTDFLLSIFDAVRPHTIRIMLWHTERDPEGTPWLHIPMNEEELVRTKRVVEFIQCISPSTNIRLSNAPLWEALPWLNKQLDEPIHPNNPFSTYKELSDAMYSSMDLISTVLAPLNKPDLSGRIQFDIWNEFDVTTQIENAEVMQLYYPAVSSMLFLKAYDFTVSAIIDTNGDVERADKTYDFIHSFRSPKPSFMEVHLNGLNTVGFQRVVSSIGHLKRKYKCDVSIGEIDVETTLSEEKKLLRFNPIDICYWR